MRQHKAFAVGIMVSLAQWARDAGAVNDVGFLACLEGIALLLIYDRPPDAFVADVNAVLVGVGSSHVLGLDPRGVIIGTENPFQQKPCNACGHVSHKPGECSARLVVAAGLSGRCLCQGGRPA